MRPTPGRQSSTTETTAAARDAEVDRRSLLAAQQMAGLGSWEWDPRSDFLECSTEMCRILGVESDAGKVPIGDVMARIHPADVSRMAEELRSVREGRLDDSVADVRIVHRSGRTAWIRAFSRATLDGRGLRANGAVLDITDLKTAEQERELRERAMEASTMPISISDGAGRYRYVNRAFSDLAGVPAESLVGTLAADFVPDKDTAEQIQRTLFETGRWAGDVPTIHPDGSAHEVHAVANVITGPHDAEPLVVVSFLDITEQKQALRELAQRERQLRQASELARIGVYYYDAATRHYIMPPETRQLLGLGDEYASYSAEQGRALIHPDDWDMLDREARDMIARRAEYGQSTYRFISPTKGVIHVQVIHETAWDDDGRFTGLNGIIQDVTPMREAESEAREARKKAEQYLDIAGTMILAVDLDGRVELINRRGGDILGYSQQELIGKDWFDLAVPEEDREAGRAFFAGLIRTGDDSYHTGENDVVTRSGERRRLATVITTLKDRDGRATGFLASGHDLTDLRKAEARLLEASRMAGMAEIATNVLHNVGNVLNSVNVSASVVAESMQKSELSSLAQVVALLRDHEADLGAFLTQDSRGKHLMPFLIQLSEHLRSEQKSNFDELSLLRRNIDHIKEIVAIQQTYAGISNTTEEVDIRNLVEECLRLSGVGTIEVVRDIAELPTLHIDRRKTLQILVNLVSNGKDACNESGRADKRLTLRVEKGDGRVTVAVSDNGIGIPEQNLTTIFSHGFTTKKNGHGFGLHGAAIAAREMGGSLRVESGGIGRGATFTLELPANQGRARFT